MHCKMKFLNEGQWVIVKPLQLITLSYDIIIDVP